MNQGRLFVHGQLLYRNLTLSQALLGEEQVQVPSNSTFISHQSNDKDAAERLAVSLSSRGYPCYLDTFDPNVDGDSPELESYLRRVIALCNNLMAMVSRTTRISWWVPLEIGVALEKEKHIATYLLTAEDLPSYLWQWPMLRRVLEKAHRAPRRARNRRSGRTERQDTITAVAGQTRHPIGAEKHRKPPSPAGEQAAYQRSQAWEARPIPRQMMEYPQCRRPAQSRRP